MDDKYQTLQTGNELFEAFVEQVKQALEHLYDFAYLQQHELARVYDGDSDITAKTAGRQLRYTLITAIESLKPALDVHFRAPDARLYNILHLYYVESLTIYQAAAELGLSERQAYRDLRRGQESVAAVLWDSRLPASSTAQDFSFQSEMARLKLNVGAVDVGAVFRQARSAVERLAQQHSVDIDGDAPAEPLIFSTDPVLAHQVMVSVLSYTIQQAQPGKLSLRFEQGERAVTLLFEYHLNDNPTSAASADSTIGALARRLRWTISAQELPDNVHQVAVRVTSSNATILVMDDNEGWVALLERFLEGYDCLIVAVTEGEDILTRAQELNPAALILDIMMPQKDGWELLQRLRTQPATAEIPIIICSVFNDPQLAYSLGASAFLPKPAHRETLLSALKKLDVL